jgi:acetoacetyl-CoA synthetase
MRRIAQHLNVTRNDRVFYYTTTGWMMWNWLVSVLGVGATIVLFEGNPLYPSARALWQYAEVGLYSPS